MSHIGTHAALLGREGELAKIRALIDDARRGEGGALLLSGEPGSGKTALLDTARALSAGSTVVSCCGVEWEAELPFSGLHELLRPLLPLMPALPEPQRTALEGALGIGQPEAVQPLNVFAGAHSLILEATRAEPVLLVVDDLQWIDSATLQVLSFVCRRLEGEPIAMLMATRPRPPEGGLPAPIDLAPLDSSAVRALAERHLGRAMPGSAIADLTRASGGNPLAVVESVHHFGDELWLRGSLLDEPLPVGALIERGFADRLAGFSTEARAALELVAASLVADLGALSTAMDRLGIAEAAIDEAEAGGAISMQAGAVVFAHPLLRALVHRTTDPGQLRRCHAALAEALNDPGLCAWHRANAATVPDESVAAALDQAAGRFAVRGGGLAAAQALERAAELSPDPDARAGRYFRASSAAHISGRGDWAMTLVREGMDCTTDPRLTMRGRYQQACLDTHMVGGRIATHRAVVEAARGVDDDLLVEALCSMAIDSVNAGREDLGLEALEQMLQLRETPGLSRPSYEELDAATGMLLAIMGVERWPGESAALLRGVAEQRLKLSITDHGYFVEGLVWVEEFELAQRLCELVISLARAQSDAFTLTGGLGVDGYRRFRIGDWDGAERVFGEAIEIGDSLEHEGGYAFLVRAHRIVLQAARGDDGFRAVVPRLEVLEHPFEFGLFEEYIGTALGLADLVQGRPAEAARHFERARHWKRAAGQREPYVSWPADLVEAYALAGDVALARERLEELREHSLRSPRPWAVASVARLDALLADDDAYEARYEQALRAFDATRAPFDRARTHLAYGQRLRRLGRRVKAREHLGAAHAEFVRLGAAPWAEQAGREMGASVPTLRKGSSGDPEVLTPQERRVADLVAEGATNKEAAGAMFLSPKTIETHLSRIYRKLGVASRTQLAAQMRQS